MAIFPSEEKNSLLVSGSSDNSIKLWDIRQKQSINTWKGHSMPINTLDCSFDGKWIVSGSQDELIKVILYIFSIKIYRILLDLGS